ncbi:hypothetical protein RHGRI_030539 [Rhododendron griersonianum]|uniref:Pentatricopeptide repeat-containing protein n=1 Tax=Rhododendron griersonianum TaxID=479676 RepID=A0AAV6ISI1_9ERIC|nr:hypothetical protein RHGRI_030539 [Rhododendron griersonianum]
MIGGYVQSGEAVVAFMLFRKMVSNNKIEMDGQIMVNVIKACIHMGKVSIAREMPMRSNVSWNSLLAGFISNEKYPEALSLFDSTTSKEGIEADEAKRRDTCSHLEHNDSPIVACPMKPLPYSKR